MPSVEAASVVLDTQVVLDWLVFRDPGCAALQQALESGSVRWLTSQAMCRELEQVLDRGAAAAWKPDRAAVAAALARFAVMVEPLAPPGPPLRCRDPDDQMFIDLALAHGVRCLFTRDKALLKLARRARLRGVEVLSPAAWQRLQTAEPKAA